MPNYRTVRKWIYGCTSLVYATLILALLVLVLSGCMVRDGQLRGMDTTRLPARWTGVLLRWIF